MRLNICFFSSPKPAKRSPQFCHKEKENPRDSFRPGIPPMLVNAVNSARRRRTMKRNQLIFAAFLAFALAQQTFARVIPPPPPPPEPYWLPFLQMVVTALTMLF